MADIRAQVELLLKDKLSPAVKGASANVRAFGNVASQVANVSGRAFDSLGAKVGGLGIAFGALNLVKFNVDYEDKLIRLGTSAGATAGETNALKRELLETARVAKIGVDGLVDFGTVLADNAVSIEKIRAAAPLAAAAMQGLGMSGSEVADFYSVLDNRGASLDEITEKLNNVTEIASRSGSIGVSGLVKELPKLIELSGGSVDNIEEMAMAIAALGNGTSGSQAISGYEKAMQEFASADTQNAIRRYLRFDTKNFDGSVKSFADIADVLIAKGNELGNMDRLQELGLSRQTILTLKTYKSHYQNTIDKVGELGDTTDAVTGRANRNAASVKSNLESIQSSLKQAANEMFAWPLEKLAKFANEHPEGLKNAIYGITGALTILAGMKAFNTVFSFVSQLRSIKAPKVGGIGGGAGIPVHVTNPGAMGGGNLLDGTPINGKGNVALNNARGAVAKLTPGQYAAGGAAMGLTAAFVKIPQMMGELEGIRQNEDLTAKERGRAEGGAIGDAAGGIVGGVVGGLGGVAAGAAAGAAIGSIVPGLGTAVGALVGAGVGALGIYLGSRAGRAIGENIGEAMAGNDGGFVPPMEGVPVGAMENLTASGGSVGFRPEPVVVGTEVVFRDERTEARTYNRSGGTLGGYNYQTGWNPDARNLP